MRSRRLLLSISRTDMWSRSQRKSFKTCKQVNKIKLTFIKCFLVMFFIIFMNFRPFITYNVLVLSFSERQDILDHVECFSFAAQIRLRAVHNNIDNFQKIYPLCHKQVIACFFVKLRINITRVFRSCRNSPSREAKFTRSRAITLLIFAKVEWMAAESFIVVESIPLVQHCRVTALWICDSDQNKIQRSSYLCDRFNNTTGNFISTH